MMNIQFTHRFLVLTLLCVSMMIPLNTFAMADATPKKEIALPDGALNAQQIDAQFKGKTVLAEVPVKGKQEGYYFAENGNVVEVRDGLQKDGKWFVREDGRLCIDLEGEHKDCRMIIKEGDKYHQYAAKLDGNHVYEQTYYDFRKGEQLKAMSPSPLLPKTTLTRDEVIELFSGKTVESVTSEQGRVSLSYYSPDGKVEQERNGVMRYGTWRVTSSARMCMQMEDLQEKCRIIVKEGNEYKKYIVKKNGDHQHSVSYRKFLKGRHL